MTDVTQPDEMTNEEILEFFKTATVEEMGKRYRDFYDMLPQDSGLIDADTCLKMLAPIPMLIEHMRDKGVEPEWAIAIDNLARITFIAANTAYWIQEDMNNGKQEDNPDECH